ncbi:MAG: translation initiation factor IF-3, partial [Candidatus Latescibacterota bacterium]
MAREQRTRVNRMIRIPEIRVIDEEGEQLGVMATQDAQRLADDKGLDLVEVSPSARPPVCRIMDYG